MRDAEKSKKQLINELKQCREEFKKFTYVVSHDLRTPLINLKGFSTELRFALETIQSSLTPLLPHLDETQQSQVKTAIEVDVPESLEFIEFAVSRIDSFINSVLRLSRLSRRQLKIETLDMDQIVQQALESLNDEIEQRQVEIDVHAPLPEIVGDRTCALDIMQVLLKNAVVYLDPDRPGEIEVSGQRRSNETIISVWDNGRGIAAGDMAKVFEPFRRAGRQDVPGEGMGLVYAQTLARLHGGRITCESELDVGSTFVLTIDNHLLVGDSYGD